MAGFAGFIPTVGHILAAPVVAPAATPPPATVVLTPAATVVAPVATVVAPVLPHLPITPEELHAATPPAGRNPGSPTRARIDPDSDSDSGSTPLHHGGAPSGMSGIRMPTYPPTSRHYTCSPLPPPATFTSPTA